MRILIAPNAFKGSIGARAAAEAIAAGMPEHVIRIVPLADGGDGTLDVFDPATLQHVATVDALRRPHTSVLSLDDGVAVIELARICGIAALVAPEPWVASSLGLGYAARTAIDRGAHTVVLALGGSASTDAGIGLLIGLGAEVLDGTGYPVAPNLAGLLHAGTLDTSAMLGRDIRWRVLADITSPLLGPAGAAYGYGPQKGLSGPGCALAEAAMRRWIDIVGGDAAIAGGAAAGGIAWTAAIVLGANIERGSDVIAEHQGFVDALTWAELVITGEGRFDEQSLMGKASGDVIARARAAGVPVAVIAGDIAVGVDQLTSAGVRSGYALIEISGDLATALADPAAGLTRAGQQLAATLSL